MSVENQDRKAIAMTRIKSADPMLESVGTPDTSIWRVLRTSRSGLTTIDPRIAYTYDEAIPWAVPDEENCICVIVRDEGAEALHDKLIKVQFEVAPDLKGKDCFYPSRLRNRIRGIVDKAGDDGKD